MMVLPLHDEISSNMFPLASFIWTNGRHSGEDASISTPRRDWRNDFLPTFPWPSMR